MINQELLTYLREQLATGVSKENLTATLVQHGWSSKDIAEGFAALTPRTQTATPKAPILAKQPSYLGRKLALSLSFVALTLVYGYSQRSTTTLDTTTVATTETNIDTTGTVAVTQTTPTPTPQTSPAVEKTLTPTPTPVIKTPPPVVKPKGQYADGTYTGSGADALYGTIQVKAVVNGGKLTDVIFLQYPNDRRTSIQINQQAMPILREEAIAAQSAQVSGVSGASDTSDAFVQSLGSALAQAKA